MTTLLFTKSHLPLSKIIRWGLNIPCSHFAICFDNKIVFHSNLLGAHLQWARKFADACTIVYKIEMDYTKSEEDEIYNKIITKFDARGYDFGAFIYFVGSAILHKFFGQPMPRHNLFNVDDAFLCTELATCLPIRSFKTLDADFSMMDPYQLYNLIKDDSHGETEKKD